MRTQAEETVRTIYSLTVTKADDLITIRISGSGFLYNMVRIIAGTLVKIGMGVYPPEKMEEILEEKNRAAAGPTIPARGLTLVSLEYEKSWHRTWRAKISTGTMCSIREMSRRKGLHTSQSSAVSRKSLTACCVA